MEALGKSPVNIIQELIGIHTTRKEAYERLGEKAGEEQLTKKLSAGVQQSDGFITALMEELSQFGDGVSGEVDLDNEFNQIWKNSLDKLETMNNSDVNRTYEMMEKRLQNTYRQIQESAVELTEPLQEIVQKQAAAVQV